MSKIVLLFGQVQQMAWTILSRLQSIVSHLWDKASSLDAQEWKKIIVQTFALIVVFLVLRWLFQKIF